MLSANFLYMSEDHGMPNRITKLSDELGFDAESEGYIQIGPFKRLSFEDVQRKMNVHGVFAFREGCEVTFTMRKDGLFLTAISEDVAGHLMQPEDGEEPAGNEAWSSDIEAFFDDVLEIGEVISIEGSRPDWMGGYVLNRARYGKTSSGVLSDVSRNIYQENGNRIELDTDFTLSAYEAQKRACCKQVAQGAVVSLDAYRNNRTR